MNEPKGRCSLCGATAVLLNRLTTTDEFVCAKGGQCAKRRRENERQAKLPALAVTWETLR